ncbi:MAG: cell division protein FtsQ/DivIB [Microcoleaceae cyanobacterium]
MVSLSEHDLSKRRQRLRKQRRKRIFLRIWHTMAATTLSGTLLWAIAQPNWSISQPEQIEIAGNQLLSEPAILSLLALNYPESIWLIKPQDLVDKLEASGVIADAQVSRQLFPPSLTITVQERQPVAITSPTKTVVNNPQSMGLLDNQGNWLPLESYTNLEKNSALPELQVIGNVEQFRPYWQVLYQIISRSPVKISQVDWQDPSNIILNTELGKVHLGPYGPQLTEQLNILDRMRKLPEQLDKTKAAYIDLRNPASPLIQLPPSPPPEKAKKRKKKRN